MPQHHRLTIFIEQLNEKANLCNKFAICKACKIKVNYEYAYENKFANTKLLYTDSELTKQRVQNKKKRTRYEGFGKNEETDDNDLMMPSDINTSAITSNVSCHSSISSISTHITSTSRDSGPMDKFNLVSQYGPRIKEDYLDPGEESSHSNHRNRRKNTNNENIEAVDELILSNSICDPINDEEFWKTQIKQLYHSSNALTNEKNLNNDGGENNINGNELSFERIMNLWNQMLRNEILDDKSDLEDENNEMENFDIDNYLSEYKYPQRDSTAKWKLENLFSVELEVPEYVNNL
ncbi:7208_t:CDS:2 [Funneliformis mosseae]|uniref:7208_t:CDS:1 n=1 Tax=Funneliformis mosseae TaxID=27381 RepID=A0A9N9C986_FUNMO|nr:7208_t:CDS:2 [Funneliformis mosseae]